MRRVNKQFLKDNFLGISLTLLGSLILVLVLVVKNSHHGYAPDFALASGSGLSGDDISTLENMNRAFSRIVDTVNPAIVNIQSTHVVKVQQSPFMNDPFFRQFFGQMFPSIPREQREHALGSGVIVSPDGYIVTNNHVIRQATDIKVMMTDKRVFTGKVIGADPQTDVAVVKIDAKNLPTAPLGDSSTLHVGDIVMAFGNPFGLNFTVTRGSVSALGRSDLGIERYEDFIQTDAAINPGNSGGALVNVRGQVVGINTAILSSSSGPGGEGGFNGVGFAIPSNIVKHVMEELIKSGKVSRGYMGIRLGDVTPDIAKQFNVPDVSGAMVESVEPGSPAEKAGLKAGDVIRTYNGKTVSSLTGLQSMVANTNPDTTVSVGILRDGKAETVKMTLGEQPASLAGNAGGPSGGGKAPSNSVLSGISVQNLTPAIRQQLNLPERVHGVVIADIDPNSAGAQSGLQQGDVIESISRQPVNSVSDFNRLASAAKGQTLLRIVRDGNPFFVVISPVSGGNGDQNP